MSAKILALDTSTENCSVALILGQPSLGHEQSLDRQSLEQRPLVQHCYTRSEVSPRGHTQKILPMVDSVLKEAGVTLGELDAIAYGRGPGSFTGVRIGIGIAQGLAFGADLPMIGISTLAAMAQACYRVHGQSHAACAIDARMNEVYWGQFARQDNGAWRVVDTESVISPAALLDRLASSETAVSADRDQQTWSTAGTGWQAYHDVLVAMTLPRVASDVLFPEAEDIAFLAQYEWATGNTVPAELASPVYLRDKVTWKKLPGRE
jgi:tRNA threonylcarbamoyladenosine biosynthesis protein TsaB